MADQVNEQGDTLARRVGTSNPPPSGNDDEYLQRPNSPSPSSPTNPFSAVPPPTPLQSNVHVHSPNNPVPKFSGDSETFITWKACMMKYIAGVERNLPTILKNGPYIPGNISPVINPDGSQRFKAKEKDHWSEEDHRWLT